MIIYNCKTKKLPTSTIFLNNDGNTRKMFNYDYDLMSSVGDYKIQEQVTSDVYYTYNTLVNFNNSLDDELKGSFHELRNYLDSHYEIKESKDRRCQIYYEKMERWYKKYISNPSDKCIKEISDEIQSLMRFLAKQEIIKESGCNLKRNYY